VTLAAVAALQLAHSVPLFLAGATVLVVGGVLLARAADEIAERTGLSRLFVGMLLLALATSLPEIVTDMSAAAAGAPDLAVADLFGSSMANMAILAVVDLARRGRVWPSVELGQARIGSIAIALTALAAVAVLTTEGFRLAWIGIDTILIAVAYVAAVAWVRRAPTPLRTPGVAPTPTGWVARSGSLRGAVVLFAAAAALIGVSAPTVALAAREIAAGTGLGEAFVGIALVAIATSLPELVVSIAAIRIGAHDLAVGNLFGSNAANMAALLFVDLAYRPGPVLAAVDSGVVVAGVCAILLMALAVTAIVHGEETRLGRLEPDAVLLLIAYAGSLVAVWSVR
jgi:cation:H+ antiporter